MGPAHPFQRIEHRFGDGCGKRADQFIQPESFDVVGGIRPARLEFMKLQLRDPDRIRIAHADRHQPRDFAEHRLINARPADKSAHAINIKLRVAWALIVDQKVNALADDRNRAIGQTVRQQRRRAAVIADEVGEQIAKRGQDACHLRPSRFF